MTSFMKIQCFAKIFSVYFRFCAVHLRCDVFECLLTTLRICFLSAGYDGIRGIAKKKSRYNVAGAVVVSTFVMLFSSPFRHTVWSAV